MPRYEVMTNEPLSSDRKAELARDITDAHVQTTGAPPSFVHVVFATTGSDNTFVAGEPRAETCVRGAVRAGRDDATTATLLAKISAATARTTGAAEDDVVVWLHEAPGSRIMEGGRVLPEPGEEEAWLAER